MNNDIHQILEEQDQHINEIHVYAKRIKDKSHEIGNEIGKQTE